jgi:hypothetical protein
MLRIILASCTLATLCWVKPAAASSIDVLPKGAGIKFGYDSMFPGTGFPDIYTPGRDLNSFTREPLTSRGYISFDLAGVAAPIASAQLRSVRGSVITPDASETVELYEVTTPRAELSLLTSNLAAYDDLGTGTVYGSSSNFYPGAPEDEIIAIDLSAAAIAKINASHGGEFTIGLALTSLNADALAIELVFVGTLPNLPVLRLTLVPEPTVTIMSAVGACFIMAMRVRRQRSAV